MQAARDEGFNYRFSGISFSGNEGWIIGKPAILLHTTDGRETHCTSQLVWGTDCNALHAPQDAAVHTPPRAGKHDAGLMHTVGTQLGVGIRRRRELGAGAAEREAPGQPNVHPRTGRQVRPGRDGDGSGASAFPTIIPPRMKFRFY